MLQVKTGEEGWEVVFSQRAKTYRYDGETKQWKERGIGEFKIQHEPNLNKYRLLQRREQVNIIVLSLLIFFYVNYKMQELLAGRCIIIKMKNTIFI